jgi:uncharacterized protein (TIGR03067 family)
LHRRRPPGRLDAMLTAPLLLALTLAPADAPTPPDGPPPPAAVRVEDAGELQGEWEIVAVIRDGDDLTLLFEGRPFVFYYGRAGTGREAWTEFPLAVDPAADPPAIDLKPWGLRRVRGVERGIYRRSGATLVVAYQEKINGSRPTVFESHAGSGVSLSTLRRVKK